MKTADKTAAHELALFIINDSELYRSQTQPIIANLKRKRAKGVYSPELAVKLYRYLADSGAKKYTFEFDIHQASSWRQVKGYGIFDVAMRNETARELRDYYDEQVRANPARKRRAKKRSKARHSERGFFPATPRGRQEARIDTYLHGRTHRFVKRKMHGRGRLVKINPLVRAKRELSIPERHQLKIARDTLKMPPQMAAVMGGPTPAEAREIIRRLTGKVKRNPATHIKMSPHTYMKQGTSQRYRQFERQRRRRAIVGGFDPDKHSPYRVQVKRGKKWITLARFPYKANASDYGHALKYRYPSKTIRVFW